MKFKEWRKTARYLQPSELAVKLQDCMFEEPDAPPCLLYDGNLYIERVDHEQGTWMLTIGNNGRITGDLLSLEKELYIYAVCEGLYTYEADYDEAQLEEIIKFIQEVIPVIRLDKGRCTIYVDSDNNCYHAKNLRDAVYQAILERSINE